MNISNPMILKSLFRQQNDLINNYPEGVKILMNQEDILDIQAEITGPTGTPYENGVFRVKLILPTDFPQAPPKGYFTTKIYHPNVSAKGEICVNTLKKDWNPRQWSLFHVLQVIRCLLIVPFPESSLNEEAGRLFQENYQEYFKMAKIYTNVHSSNGESEKEVNIKSNNNTLSENNNRQNIINNEKNEKNVFQKAQSNGLVSQAFSLDIKKHAKSYSTSTKEVAKEAKLNNDEKINLSSFSLFRASSITATTTTSNEIKVNPPNNNKSKQEEIKKWLSRL